MTDHIANLIERNRELSPIREELAQAAELIVSCYQAGGKVLICGNGGSAADSEHIAGELLKGFLKRRPLPETLATKLPAGLAGRLQMGLPAVSLVSHSALLTAVINDLGSDLMYAQQVMALGTENDVLIGLSTSGNAENVVNAFHAAAAKGIRRIAMTGERDSRMSALADITLRVPASSTPEVQEYHLKLYHTLCAQVEEYFFPI